MISYVTTSSFSVRRQALSVFLYFLLATLTVGSVAQEAQKNNVPSVGVFYYPGWRANVPGLAFSPPWRPIQKFPEREPLLGWYDDGDQSNVDTQLRWMNKYGIDYVVFDWYWGRSGTFLEQSVRAYMASKIAGKIPFAIMWANHDAEPTSVESFRKMVEYWIENYLGSKEYMSFNARPVVYIFSAEQLKAKALAIGESPAGLLSMAQSIARQHGLGGISFFMGVSAGSDLVNESSRWGVDGYFAYNYHSGANGLIKGVRRSSRSYSELSDAYQDQWDWFSNNSVLPYILPVTAGWDRRAWGGSADPEHDLSVSSPEQFDLHLSSAKQQLKRKGDRTNSILVCCWNEHGEGSVVEPTRKFNFQYLDAIRNLSPGRQVFGE